MLPHPRPYTLPFGQVASAKTQLVTTLGGAALFGFFGAVILHGVGRTGSGVGAAAGAALGAFLGKTLADKFA
jgi:outer membrane lipoprotein SlyB